jgi:NitT/TauT family transport system substrate-binding protein
MVREGRRPGWAGRRMGTLMATLALAALPVLAGCGGDDQSSSSSSSAGGQEVTKVKVGVLPISNVAPLYLGMKKGFFKAEGLEIEPQMGQSGNEITTALVAGDSQFIFVGWVPLASARSKGLPVKAVSNADNGAKKAEDEWTVILVSKNSPIKDVADLAGKTIAVNALKGVGETDIKAALEKRHVDPNSVKLLEVPFPEMPAALDKNRVDAIWAPEPFLTQELEKGAREIEAPLTTLGPLFPNGAYATSEQFLSKNPDAVQGFVRAIRKSLDYATAHPDEARATIPTFTKIPPEVAKKIRLPVWPSKIDRPHLQQLLDYAVKYKVIEKAPPLDELLWDKAQ